jgi:GNAT superfamily N-acetyltransferase
MQVPGYTVRLARRPEVAAVLDIEREAYRAPGQAPAPVSNGGGRHNRPLDGLVTANDDGRLWVALDTDESIVGLALVRDVGLFAHVDALAVLPAHGRHGLGAALLEAVVEWAFPRGFSAVTIAARRDLTWQAEALQRRGFEELPIADVPPELIDAVRTQRGGAPDPNIDAWLVFQREI